MYLLKITGSQPALYKGIDDGFIDTVETETQALQFVRITDAQSFKDLIQESTEVVFIA